MIDFDTVEASADEAIDQHFGEKVTLTPYTKDQYQAPSVDGSRPVQEWVGYVVGRRSQSRSAGPMGALSNRMEAERVFSVQKKYITGAVSKGDRVFFQKRNEHWEVAVVEPSAYNRVKFQLLTVPA